MDPAYTIRPATPADFPAMGAVEITASQRFREVGLGLAAALPPLPVWHLRRAQEEGWAWVAASASGEVVGFLVGSVLDGVAHVDEVNVLPEHGRRGIGRALLETLAARAREQGLPAITLATFRHVPWNYPFYRSAGFRELGREELTPGLREIRRLESGVWIALAAERVLMRREL